MSGEAGGDDKGLSASAKVMAGAGAAMLLSIGLCGTHLSAAARGGNDGSMGWMFAGTMLAFVSVGAFFLSILLAIIESRR